MHCSVVVAWPSVLGLTGLAVKDQTAQCRQAGHQRKQSSHEIPPRHPSLGCDLADPSIVERLVPSARQRVLTGWIDLVPVVISITAYGHCLGMKGRCQELGVWGQWSIPTCNSIDWT